MNQHTITVPEDTLLDVFILFTKLFHKPYTKEALLSGLPIHENQKLFSKGSPKSLFSRVAARAGLKTTLIKRPIKEILSLHLPMILLLSNENVCILEQFNEDRTEAKIIYPEGDGLEQWLKIEDLEAEYLGFGYMLKKEFEYDTRNSRTLKIKQNHWFWSTVKLSASIYKDVIWASLLINLFVIAAPLYTMNVYDRVLPNHATETLLVFTIGIIFVYLLDFFMKSARVYMLEVAAKKSDIIMSSIIFEKVLDLKMSVHPDSVGFFANSIKNFETVRSFFTTATMTAIVDFPFTIIFIIVMYYIGGVLAFVPITTIVLMLLFAFMVRKPLEVSIESAQEAGSKKNAVLIESLQNIETVKSMSMAGKQQWKWEESTGEIAEKNQKARMLGAAIPNVTGLLIHLNTVFVIVIGVFLINDFELTKGGLIAVMILSGRTIGPMGKATALISSYADAKSAYETLNTILGKEAERPEGEEFIRNESFQGQIEFKDVSFSYPNSEIQALTNISFVIKPKEKVAFVGKIGSGKSTIAKLILKLYEPTSGSILLDGIDIGQIDPADVRRFISYVPQEVSLFKGTIKDNIVSSEKHPDIADIIYATQVSGVDDFVQRHPLGFDMPIGERGTGLSGGQRQAVGVARALMQNSSIMLLDEPTNAMDQTTEKKLLNRLSIELKDKTILLITQKMSLLSMVDRVIVIHNSKLLIDDTKEVVMKKLEGKVNA